MLNRLIAFGRVLLVSSGELAVALVIGLGVRAYGLRTESVWLDELFSAAYVDRPSLLACLRDQRPENWEMVPLYYSLQYAWAQWVGTSPVSLRWLSILFALLSIALLYKMGRDIFGRWAGFVAALALALSPTQIFHGQGIRPYGLVVLLAVASMYAFQKFCIMRRPRWLWVNLMANIGLFWTHLFAPLLLIPQAVCLVLYHRRERGQIALWGGTHAAALVPLLLWVRTIRVVPSPWRQPPGLGRFCEMLFGQESEMIRWTIGFPEKVSEASPSPLISALLARLHTTDTMVFWMLVLGFVWTGVWLLWMRIRLWRRATEAPAEPDAPARSAAVLMCWFLLPIAALFAIANMWQPIAFQSRYVVFCFPALYLMAGLAIARIRPVAIKGAATALFLAPYLYLAVLAMALPLRTDFLGAGRILETQASQDDTVIVPDYNVLRTLAFNMRPSEIQLVRNEWPAELWDFIVEALDSEKTIWFIFSSDPAQEETRRRLEGEFALKDIPYDKTALLGMQNLYVYRCSPNRGAT